MYPSQKKKITWQKNHLNIARKQEVVIDYRNQQ